MNVSSFRRQRYLVSRQQQNSASTFFLLLATFPPVVVIAVVLTTDPVLPPQSQKQLDAQMIRLRSYSSSEADFLKCEPSLRRAITFSALRAGELTPQEAQLVNDALKHKGCIDQYSGIASPKSKPTIGNPVLVIETDSVLYIRIRTFLSQAVSQDLNDATSRLAFGWRTRVSRIFIDMRGNLGGFTDQMGIVLERFAPAPGIKYSHVRDSRGQLFHRFVSQRFGDLTGIPTLIFVDENCASACEWFARIMRYEWKTAIVIGQPTFGKGVVQCVDVGAISIRATCLTIEVAGKPYDKMPLEPDVRLEVARCGVDDLRCLVTLLRAVKMPQL